MKSLFIDAIWGKEVPRFPIWMMRQAGRYLPEYKKLKAEKAEGSFWKMVKSPELAAEITLQPLKRFGVDALILFSDILTPLPAMGFQIDFVPYPKFGKNALQIGIDNLKVPDDLAQRVDFVTETIKLIKKSTDVPLIGFGGSPYTLACYALKDDIDRYFANPRKLYYQDRELYDQLLSKLSLTVQQYLNLQIEAGVDAVMLFDTWAGSLSLPQYEKMSLPYVKQIMGGLKTTTKRLPKLYYSSRTTDLMQGIKKTGVDVVVADWQSPISFLKKELDEKWAICGNLDPAVLCGSVNNVRDEVNKILNSIGDYRRFVFNLGHGIYQDTPLDNVAMLIDTVKNHRLN
ncbi:MAG: uroporphyrinogen decarboxylase [SAR324 cluster bacterium]|nr:uroporphyrinogen decarboxylase [SAR324 cluster bacterium]